MKSVVMCFKHAKAHNIQFWISAILSFIMRDVSSSVAGLLA